MLLELIIWGLCQKGEAISSWVRLFPLRVRLFTMGEAISPRVRLFPLRVRLFQDITSPWAPVGAKKDQKCPILAILAKLTISCPGSKWNSPIKVINEVTHPSWTVRMTKVATREVVYYRLSGNPRGTQKCLWPNLRAPFLGDIHPWRGHFSRGPINKNGWFDPDN